MRDGRWDMEARKEVRSKAQSQARFLAPISATLTSKVPRATLSQNGYGLNRMVTEWLQNGYRMTREWLENGYRMVNGAGGFNNIFGGADLKNSFTEKKNVPKWA